MRHCINTNKTTRVSSFELRHNVGLIGADALLQALSAASPEQENSRDERDLPRFSQRELLSPGVRPKPPRFYTSRAPFLRIINRIVFPISTQTRIVAPLLVADVDTATTTAESSRYLRSTTNNTNTGNLPTTTQAIIKTLMRTIIIITPGSAAAAKEEDEEEGRRNNNPPRAIGCVALVIRSTSSDAMIAVAAARQNPNVRWTSPRAT